MNNVGNVCLTGGVDAMEDKQVKLGKAVPRTKQQRNVASCVMIFYKMVANTACLTSWQALELHTQDPVPTGAGRFTKNGQSHTG